VHKVLVAEDVYYPGESETSEFYVSVLLNRATGRNMIMYSTEGGMDIEEVAEHTPHLIFTEEIDPSVGLQGFQARKFFNLGLSGNAFKEMVKFIDALYKAYIGSDASMFEINSFKTSDDKILAVDAKVNIDDNALYRQKSTLRCAIFLKNQSKLKLRSRIKYVDLDGTVGCMLTVLD
jgi:succinyl-CoA synthetase beta subunit